MSLLSSIFGSWVGKKAPDISGDAWFNESHLPARALEKVKAGEKLDIEDFAGKVVLIDFWDYSCVNCVNTLPYLKEWWKRYQQYDFLIIGVHTPEFEFGKEKSKVQDAVLRFGLNYSVVSDPNYETWKRYKNNVWPREFIVNSKGVIKYDHKGEGSYDVKEKKIQDLIHEIHPDAVFDNPMTAVRETDKPGAVCRITTPEVYLGYKRAKNGNKGELKHDAVFNYELPKNIPLNLFILRGSWRVQAEESVSAPEADQPSEIILHYVANDVFSVLRPVDAESVEVEIQQNDQSLTEENKGEDVRIVDGKSIVTVDSDRLYHLVKNPEYGQFYLTLLVEKGHLAAHTFTFGSSCE